jgi:hypothetical protein
MAFRTTEQGVLDIMDNDLTTAQVTPYLTSSNIFVTETLLSVGLSDEILAEIEKWLTAHMIALTKDRISKEEGAGGAYIKWAGIWEKGFNATPYGQMAMNLDSSNTLATIVKQKSSAWTKAVPGV